MSLITQAEALAFLGIEAAYFDITAVNNVLIFAYNAGSATSVTMTDGTYTSAQMAAHMETQIDTALSATSTVTFDSTTTKFTIAVSAGNTIAYTNSGSNGGTTFGFTADASAALSITSDSETGDPTAIVDWIQDGVEKRIKNYCHKDLESTSYSEKYNGSGSRELSVDNYPITAVSRLAIGTRTAINIRNTGSNTTASVSVSSTALTLTRDGSADATLLFATYTTMTLLIAEVNDTGDGWVAEVVNSDYNSFQSSDLVIKMGLNVNDSVWGYLGIPSVAESDFEVYDEEGIIVNSVGFPRGRRNIHIDYTAGYSTTPDDLKLAVGITLKYYYQQREEETFGSKSFKTGDSAAQFEDLKHIPSEARDILDGGYRRLLIG
ncbi:MAG TPA: hypothetical protein ENH82_12370 [bacterium]|nr:hypothetical protein [bacterium]